MIESQITVLRMYSCKRVPNSKESIYFMLNLTEMLKVELIGLQIFRITDKVYGDKKPGVSAVATYVESGSMLHTWPEDNFCELEINSCKPYDVDKIIYYCRSFFQTDDMRIIDGRDFNKKI